MHCSIPCMLAKALGGPALIAGKLRRVAVTLAVHVRPRELASRLERLRELGLVDHPPTQAQLLFGGIDMVRFVIEPAARTYYRDKPVSYHLHHLLRFLDDPSATLDPTGLCSTRDTTIGHLLQVVHLGCCDPVYDLQVLQCFDDGLDELERQVRAMLDGTHPRHAAIASIIAEPDYHRRLLDYIVAYRSAPSTPPPFDDGPPLRTDASFLAATATFRTLAGFLDYAAALPRSKRALVRRLFAVRTFPV